MTIRENVEVGGIPLTWSTNLHDGDIRQFYEVYFQTIRKPDPAGTTSSPTTFIIPLRFGFLAFRDGYCFWSASGDKHTVLYRSHHEWELWDARQKEIEELREEQAAEEAIEKQLLGTEDAYLREKTDVSIKAHEFDAASAFVIARAELREKFKQLRSMPPSWSYWSPDLIFARFPTSTHGISFFQRYHPAPQAFSNFAHWFVSRSGLQGKELAEQTKAIFEAGLKMHPDNADLTQALCLFWRRIGEYELAIETCSEAIRKGLTDKTRSGFEGRLKRLVREAQKRKERDT